MMNAVVLFSAAVLAQLPDSRAAHAPATGLPYHSGKHTCSTQLVMAAPAFCQPPDATASDSLEAALASWPCHINWPRTPRPLPCWQQPCGHLLHSFTTPVSLCDRLSHWERVIFGGISDSSLRGCRDYEHFYGGDTLLCHIRAIALAAPLANTSIDREVRDWYQHDVRSVDTDRWARTGKQFGEFWILGIYAGVLVAGKATENTWCGSTANEWADRNLRAIAVGAPAVLTMQLALGSGRPINEVSSHWRPFDHDNGVSGHAFLGAIPFLTAASMTENRLLRGTLFVASGWTAWSRVNDDQHYLSQALLGWYFAWQAVQSVSRTECEERRYHLAPFLHPEGSGLALHFRY